VQPGRRFRHPPTSTLAPHRRPTYQAGSGSEEDAAVFKLRSDGMVLFRAASTVNRPDPPFCLTPSCISGPRERGRLEGLRDALGWAVLEADGGEDAKWVQILLH